YRRRVHPVQTRRIDCCIPQPIWNPGDFLPILSPFRETKARPFDLHRYLAATPASHVCPPLEGRPTYQLSQAAFTQAHRKDTEKMSELLLFSLAGLAIIGFASILTITVDTRLQTLHLRYWSPLRVSTKVYPLNEIGFVNVVEDNEKERMF